MKNKANHHFFSGMTVGTALCNLLVAGFILAGWNPADTIVLMVFFVFVCMVLAGSDE